jgi:hypothetical protein
MNSQDKKNQLIDSSFKIIEDEGWDNFTLKKLSEKKNLDINIINQLLRSKKNLLKEFSKMIDFKVEKEFDFQDLHDSSTKDNLFELIMLRLEYMQPYKAALTRIIFSITKQPGMLRSVSNNVLDSLDFYLELTKAYDKSFFDLFKKKSILLIYSYIFKIWLDDKTEELSKTMSELDKLLTFSERLAKNLKNYALF